MHYWTLTSYSSLHKFWPCLSGRLFMYTQDSTLQQSGSVIKLLLHASIDVSELFLFWYEIDVCFFMLCILRCAPTLYRLLGCDISTHKSSSGMHQPPELAHRCPTVYEIGVMFVSYGCAKIPLWQGWWLLGFRVYPDDLNPKILLAFYTMCIWPGVGVQDFLMKCWNIARDKVSMACPQWVGVMPLCICIDVHYIMVVLANVAVHSASAFTTHLCFYIDLCPTPVWCTPLAHNFEPSVRDYGLCQEAA